MNWHLIAELAETGAIVGLSVWLAATRRLLRTARSNCEGKWNGQIELYEKSRRVLDAHLQSRTHRG